MAFGVISGPAISATEHPATIDEYLMAVQHFDPSHDLGLDIDGKEVGFVQQAVLMARLAIPEVAGIGIRADRKWDKKGTPTSHASLQVIFPKSENNYGALETYQVDELTEAILDGCGFEKWTHERRRDPEVASIRSSRYWDIARNCRDANVKKPCVNQAAIDWLCRNDIVSIHARASSYKKSNSASLYLNYGEIVDLEYKSKAVQNTQEYKQYFEGYELKPFETTIIGLSESIELVPESNFNGFKGISIKFTYGSGDCPSGCISTHYWIFTYLTQGDFDGEKWPLFGGLTEEGGDPLNEETRHRLRSAGISR
ncbi:MAG: hypothetical protein ACI9FD_004803 [Gammaproteobacteria bacterium]